MIAFIHIFFVCSLTRLLFGRQWVQVLILIWEFLFVFLVDSDSQLIEVVWDSLRDLFIRQYEGHYRQNDGQYIGEGVNLVVAHPADPEKAAHCVEKGADSQKQKFSKGNVVASRYWPLAPFVEIIFGCVGIQKQTNDSEDNDDGLSRHEKACKQVESDDARVGSAEGELGLLIHNVELFLAQVEFLILSGVPPIFEFGKPEPRVDEHEEGREEGIGESDEENIIGQALDSKQIGLEKPHRDRNQDDVDQGRNHCLESYAILLMCIAGVTLQLRQNVQDDLIKQGVLEMTKLRPGMIPDIKSDRRKLRTSFYPFWLYLNPDNPNVIRKDRHIMTNVITKERMFSPIIQRVDRLMKIHLTSSGSAAGSIIIGVQQFCQFRQTKQSLFLKQGRLNKMEPCLQCSLWRSSLLQVFLKVTKMSKNSFQSVSYFFFLIKLSPKTLYQWFLFDLAQTKFQYNWSNSCLDWEKCGLVFLSIRISAYFFLQSQQHSLTFFKFSQSQMLSSKQKGATLLIFTILISFSIREVNNYGCFSLISF